MSVTKVTPVDLTFTKDATFQDVDCSAYIPSSATGVLVEIINTWTGAEKSVAIRKNGSTDTYVAKMRRSGHEMQMIGVDGSQIFECYAEDSYISIYLIGYTESEAVFFDNAITYTASAANTYEDFDISADTGTDVAIAAIAGIANTSGTTLTSSIRKNGSTDDFYKISLGLCYRPVGVDASEIFEVKISSTTYDALCVGYFTDGISIDTNYTNVSPAGTGAYEDLTALDSSATFGIYQTFTSSGGVIVAYNVRENGETDDRYYDTDYNYGFMIKPCDSSNLCEGKIETANVFIYQAGYFFDVANANRYFTSTIF